jgi:hypothetical protein
MLARKKGTFSFPSLTGLFFSIAEGCFDCLIVYPRSIIQKTTRIDLQR